MTKRKGKAVKGFGRPPAGISGEKSSAYPKIRIEPNALAGLKAIAEERGVAVWQVMTDAALLLIRAAKKR